MDYQAEMQMIRKSRKETSPKRSSKRHTVLHLRKINCLELSVKFKTVLINHRAYRQKKPKKAQPTTTVASIRLNFLKSPILQKKRLPNRYNQVCQSLYRPVKPQKIIVARFLIYNIGQSLQFNTY